MQVKVIQRGSVLLQCDLLIGLCPGPKEHGKSNSQRKTLKNNLDQEDIGVSIVRWLHLGLMLWDEGEMFLPNRSLWTSISKNKDPNTKQLRTYILTNVWHQYFPLSLEYEVRIIYTQFTNDDTEVHRDKWLFWVHFFSKWQSLNLNPGQPDSEQNPHAESLVQ